MSQEKTTGRLVLTIDHREKVTIGTDVTVEFLFAKGQHARLAFTAPLDFKIVRTKKAKVETEEGDA